MTHTYYVQGIYCKHCPRKIEQALISLTGVSSCTINPNTNQITIVIQENVDLHTLNDALKRFGNYRLTEQPSPSEPQIAQTQTAVFKKNARTFMPLITIFSVILLFTFARQWYLGWNFMQAMRDFMGSFFLVFGSFKLMNLHGFAAAYSTYDLIAKRSSTYAYLYPFIEIGLGIAYFAQWQLFFVNLFTFVLMVVSALGVTNELRQKKEIMCACLGVVFKIPMTYVTLFEDVLMATMAFIMILSS